MRKSGTVLCLVLLFLGLCPFGSITSKITQGAGSEHFVLDVRDTFNSTYLEAFLNILEVAWSESEEIFGFATENVITVELHRSEGGFYGWGGRKPNTIELYVMDLSINVSIFLALHEYGHAVFPSGNFDNPLMEGLANFFFVVIGSEITKDYGLEIWPGGANITKMAEEYLESISSWAPGTIDAAVFLLLELYNASDALVFAQAFTNLKDEFSQKIEFALMCDFVRHMETLTSTDYSSLLMKYGFDLTNPLGQYVHGLKLTSYIVNITMYDNASTFDQTKLDINNLSIQNLTSLSLCRYYPEPDTIQDEEGPILFNYTKYGEWYPGKLVIHLRRPIDIGQSYTITISKSNTAPSESPETYGKSIYPCLFANSSNLSLTVYLPENYVIIIRETHPQPTVWTLHKVVWTHKDVVAFTQIEHTFSVRFRAPISIWPIIATILIAIVGITIIIIVYRKKYRKRIEIPLKNLEVTESSKEN